MKERFQIFNGKAVARAFWQIAAIALFTTAASSSAFAGDAQSRLPASQAASPATSQEATQAAKKNIEIGPHLEAIACRVTNLNFSQQGTDYGGSVKIKLTTEQGGNYDVLPTLYGSAGQDNCSSNYVSKWFSVGTSEVTAAVSCKPKSHSWDTFSISLWQVGSKTGYRCKPEKMPIK